MRKRLIKMAYKMPPQENWNEFRDSEQRNPNYITDEHYAKLVELGFTHGMGLLEHGADVAIRALTMAEKHGLKYYVRDEVNWANILHKDFYYLNASNYRKYQQYNSFAGVYIHDEPNASKYPDLAKMVEGYYEFFKDGSEPLVNLLPTYANHIEQLGAPNYEAYIRQYIQMVPTDYVMYDHYPFRVNREGGMSLNSDYLYNASVVAKLCKEYGKEMRTFIQACEIDNSTQEFLQEMLWFQIHTYLAYGSHAIVYYYYWGNFTTKKPGVVDSEGKPTPLCDGVKKIHEQIAAYEERLMECAWEKTLYIKGTKAHHNETEFAHFECEKEGGAFISEYDSIVGVFDYKGKKAYYVVNYTNPLLGLSNKVAFRLSDEYETYLQGTKRKVSPSGELTLDVGCGAFFLPKE